MKKQREELTTKQAEVLQFIKGFYKKNGYMPTYAEIGEGLEVSAKTVFDTVSRMEKKGYIQRDRRPRMMKIL